MLIVEYRIVMPLTVDEYRIGQLYSTAQASKNETGGGEGIEIQENTPFKNTPLLGDKFDSGQYTYKIYHLESKAPALLRYLVPKEALSLHEESYNAFPYCKTTLTNPGYMKENFILIIESIHLEGDTNEYNALELSEEQLEKREVVLIDIAGPLPDKNDYNETEDPSLFKSKKTGRGPLYPDAWKNGKLPLMTCYKLVTVECKWFGLQKRIEKLLQRCEYRLFSVFNRQVFCWIDQWYGMTITELQKIDQEAMAELQKQINTGPVRGLRAGRDDE